MRGVFLDRDGVINRALVKDGKPYPPASVAELSIPDDVPALLAQLASLGFRLLVVTNQPDIARGTQTRAEVDAIHDALRAKLPLDDILVCDHDDRDRCSCRKPLPGLILEGAARYGIDLAESFVVGDRWRDIEAGQRAGCRTVWIDYGYRERGPARAADAKVRSLAEAVEWIVAEP